MDSKGRAIGAKGAGTTNGKPSTMWAINASGKAWTEYLGCAPRHDESTRTQIHAIITAAGFEVEEQD